MRPDDGAVPALAAGEADAVPAGVEMRAARVVSRIVPVSGLPAGLREQMFRLLDRYYDQVSRARFDADLDEKDWVVMGFESGCLAGFSTLMRVRAERDGHPIVAFYSGDTVASPSVRGPNGVTGGAAAFLSHMLGHAASEPAVRHYYMHVAGTHLGYLMMTSLFRVSRPRFDQPLTPEATRILEALAAAKGLDYDRDRSIARFEMPSIPRPGVAARSAAAAANPHVRFFDAQNPHHAQGERLVSLVELTIDNLTPAARRLLRLARRDR